MDFLWLDRKGMTCYYYFVNPERGFLFAQSLTASRQITAHGVVGAKPSIMIKIKNFAKNSLNSFILLPLLLGNMSAPLMPNNNDINADAGESVSLNLNIFNHDIKALKVLDDRADKIDAYFSNLKLPLAGYGASMVAAADKYNLDWRILPALAMLETTGGKNLCENTRNGTRNHNPLGFGGCSLYFATFEDAFEAAAKTISGNGENTSHLYSGKSVEEILEVYNPPNTPGMTPGYHKKALKIMSDIESMDVDTSVLAQA